ncbi:hypothetical protein [Cerasicoccus maritimus]|uniref:hypothetical protein n=1 Tax=Cerasicoccus maritimus TaxID=490089 RepID=UPI002852584E|nr:hypothetical protein [Cerasicoccus maritimus]
MKTVILGAACGYTIEQLKPFLASCHEAIPNSDVFIFYHRDDAQAVAEAKAACPSVTLIRPGDISLRYWLNRFRRGRRRLSEMALSYGKKRSAKRRVELCSDHFVTLGYGVAIARYLWYLDWYLQQKPGVYGKVLLADTRDVFFQADPFDHQSDKPIFTGEECLEMGKCQVNGDWYVQVFGEDEYRQIGEKLILCSGVTGGEFEAMGDYLRAFCQVIFDAGNRIVRANGYDQAVHNHLLRFTPMGERVELCAEGSDRLVTLHHLSSKAISFEPPCTVKTAAGELISIVHQYDRNPKLTDAINRRYFV